MSRIKIQDLEHTEELSRRQMKGIFGGSWFADDFPGWDSDLDAQEDAERQAQSSALKRSVTVMQGEYGD